ncbi:hypothetical protein [Oceanobacillus sp. FSL H7-0719]
MILQYLDEKGEFFNEAPMVFRILADIYIQLEDIKKHFMFWRKD